MRRKTVPEVAKRMASIQAQQEGPPMSADTTAYLKYVWKSVLAFLSLLATNVATLWVTNGQPLPQNGGEWATFAVTTIGGTWLVYSKGNGPKPTSSGA